MKQINYHNIAVDDWKGTRLVFIGSDTAYTRLFDKIVRIIMSNPDESRLQYSFDKRSRPIIGRTDTLFLIDSDISKADLQRCIEAKIKIIRMSYEDATGFTADQQVLANTDWRFLKLIEKYLNIPDDDLEAHALLSDRKRLRYIIRKGKEGGEID